MLEEFKKILQEALIEFFLKREIPGRDITVKKMKRGYFAALSNDTLVKPNCLLEGTYSYDEVIKLNEATGYHVQFGFCKRIERPVAIIGNYDPRKMNGYFRYKIGTYGGKEFPEDETYFKLYSEEEAKKIDNYTVYGSSGAPYDLKEIAKIAPIKDVSLVYDSRHKYKEDINTPRVYEMDCMLEGTYTYDEAYLLSTGSLEKKDGYSGEDEPIVFATLEDGKHIGIISVWPCEERIITGFKDVWEFGKEEPKVQKITFLSEEEAKEINDYTLYIYRYYHERDKYNVERYDKTLDRRFDFRMPDGSDYRLVEIKI